MHYVKLCEMADCRNKKKCFYGKIVFKRNCFKRQIVLRKVNLTFPAYILFCSFHNGNTVFVTKNHFVSHKNDFFLIFLIIFYIPDRVLELHKIDFTPLRPQSGLNYVYTSLVGKLVAITSDKLQMKMNFCIDKTLN